MSDTMEEGVIASWLKKVGDTVESGDILAEVETDKATMELESFEDGTLLHIGVEESDSVPVDGVIAIIGEEGEDIADLLKEIESGGGNEKKEEKPKKTNQPQTRTRRVKKKKTTTRPTIRRMSKMLTKTTQRNRTMLRTWLPT